MSLSHGPIRASEGRIDYVKFVFPANDAETTLKLVAAFEERHQGLRTDFGDWPGSFHASKVYDGRGNWLQCFDIAGSLAHKWLVDMPLAHWTHIVRLDVRAEASAGFSKKQLDQISDTALSLNTRNRNMLRKTGRPRTKTDGRDAGGDLFSCGSLKSDKYFAVYTKPNENTAFELKVSGKPLGVIVQNAVSASRASRSGLNSWDVFDFLLLKLQNMLKMHSREVTGLSPREWDEQFSRQDVGEETTGLLSPAERVLSLFDALPPAEREAVLDTLLDQQAGVPSL